MTTLVQNGLPSTVSVDTSSFKVEVQVAPIHMPKTPGAGGEAGAGGVGKPLTGSTSDGSDLSPKGDEESALAKAGIVGIAMATCIAASVVVIAIFSSRYGLART